MRLFYLLCLLPIIAQAQFSIDDAIREIDFQDDTIKAVFIYVASNVTYDIKFKDSTPHYDSYEDVMDDVLENKKGVCMHYAALFHALCTRLGFKSYIISGYTKFINRPVGKLPHAWNAVNISGEWFLFDPTWASGYIMGDIYLPYYDQTWYKRTPEEFIYSHIPFDPIWQFRDKVSTHEEIALNNYQGGGLVLNNHYALLREYDEADELKRLQLSLDRIKGAGIANKLIRDKVQFIEGQIATHYHNQQVYAISDGIELLEAAQLEYSTYLSAKQQLFKQWSDKDVINSLQSFADKAKEAQKHLGSAKTSDNRLQKHVRKNMDHTRKMLQDIEQEEQFVQKYLKTWKPLRFINFL
jgi:transglutaminase/protease-like cytokinesis protein 3